MTSSDTWFGPGDEPGPCRVPEERESDRTQLRDTIDRPCSIEGCERRHYARGWCSLHWHRWWRTGDPLTARRRPTATDADYLWQRFVRDRSGCWLWTGTVDKYGYGTVGGRFGSRGAHRVVYELLVGSIPEGLTLDHLCRVRHCVNPAHLEPVTNGENVLRGIGPTARNARKTHCKHGHEFTPENTYTGRGFRECRICRAEDRRRHIERRQP